MALRSKAREVRTVDECQAAVDAHPDKPGLRLQLAEELAEAGECGEALETSLKFVRDHRQQFGEPALKTMLNVLQLLPHESKLTSTYRRKLAAALY